MRIRKLRVLALLAGLGLLAVVSTVFGMMMAVASDLPELEEPASQNSVIVDRRGERLGLLTGNQNRILLKETQIAPVMKHAIIAIEDKRFYTNDGVDLRGIGRALYQDVVAQKAVQGGSTIAQQFVKNSLAAQDRRDAVREAARGRDGLPHHAQVDQGQDPAQLPQHDLLRQRRLRHRVRRAHLLRPPAPGLRAATAGAPAPPSSSPTRRR